MELDELHHEVIVILNNFGNKNLSQFEQGYQLALFNIYTAITRNDFKKIKNLDKLRDGAEMRLS